MPSGPTPLCSRRHFLYTSAFSLAGLGLAHLLEGERAAAAPAKPDLEPPHFDLTPKRPHFAPKARAMISIFLVGGPSHLDLFDPKPALRKLDGKDFPGTVKYDNAAQASRKVLAPLWKFQRHGRCGMELSELLPHLGGVADDICLIRSMHTGVNNHIPSMYALSTGRGTAGRPTLGSWLTYGLGSESQQLPAYVALTDARGLPLIRGENWTNGWLPSVYQGTVARPQEPRILNLDPPPHLAGRPQKAQLDLIRALNESHLRDHPGESDLAARLASYELAARMQLAAKEAFDVSRETLATRALYGIDDPVTRDYGTRCLIARRLVERGVRFVQLWNVGQNWDHHNLIYRLLPERCREVDRPVAALVRDLKARGLLDTTVVHWGGEMGRLPVIQNDAGRLKGGRDHNTYGFSQWLAGGGFKGGHVHGATDEFGHHAVDGVVTHSDWLATLLHLFGLDGAKLVFRQGARELSLLEGQGKVVKALLA
jgi:hypothetical protein